MEEVEIEKKLFSTLQNAFPVVFPHLGYDDVIEQAHYGYLRSNRQDPKPNWVRRPYIYITFGRKGAPFPPECPILLVARFTVRLEFETV